MQEASKHGLFIEAPIVPKTVLIEIRLQIALANRMVDAPHSVFNQAPESFHGVGVDVANDVDLGSVVNPLVVVVHVWHVLDSMVGIEFIGKDCALGEHVFANHAEKRRAFDIIGHKSLDAALDVQRFRRRQS